MNPTPDEHLEAMLLEGGLDLFPAGIQRDVEDLLAAGQSVEPTVRATFVGAARRATDHIARTRGPLETLLFSERRGRQMEANELASIVGVDAKTLRSIERGERAIDSVQSDTVAGWATALDIERDTLSPALRASLGMPAKIASYAGERELRVTDEQQAFIDEVLRHFDHRSGSGTSTE